MLARSKKQQMAAGAALAAKRGKRSKSSLKGASRKMVRSMSEKQLREFAKTKRKKLPRKSGARKFAEALRDGEGLPHPFCIISITCFKGSALTLLVPVNGWSSIYIKNKINVIVTVSAVVIMYCALMFFIPKK